MTELEDAIRATSVAANLLKLTALDTVWTSYLEGTDRIPAAEARQLGILVDSMKDLLRETAAEARWLDGYLGREAKSVEATVANAAESALPPAHARRVTAYFQEKGGAALHAQESARSITSGAASEAEELERNPSNQRGSIHARRHAEMVPLRALWRRDGRLRCDRQRGRRDHRDRRRI